MRAHTGTLSGLLILGLSALFTPAHSEPTQLVGNMFINAMKDNTLSGRTSDGVPYNAYFLSGGLVTYEAGSGEKDTGRWRIDKDGQLCVAFVKRDKGQENCFVVKLDGRVLSWEGKTRTERGILRGSIVASFLED